MKKKSDQVIQTELLVHDLKVPMAVINAGVTSLITQTDLFGPLTEKQIRVLRRVQRNTQAAFQMVNDTLELGKSRRGITLSDTIPVSKLIRRVLTEVLDLLEPDISEALHSASGLADAAVLLKSIGVILDFEVRDWNAVVCLDEAKAAQILRNLLTNAFKHRRETIWLSGMVIAGKQLEINVRDDGKGLPQKDFQKIFKAFFTSGKSLKDVVPGHGLGLTCAAMLVENMGGEISAAPGDPAGVCFICRIPLSGGAGTARAD